MLLCFTLYGSQNAPSLVRDGATHRISDFKQTHTLQIKNINILFEKLMLQTGSNFLPKYIFFARLIFIVMGVEKSISCIEMTKRKNMNEKCHTYPIGPTLRIQREKRSQNNLASRTKFMF